MNQTKLDVFQCFSAPSSLKLRGDTLIFSDRTPAPLETKLKSGMRMMSDAEQKAISLETLEENINMLVH